ncbi:MAG: ComEC/Rec2 family competence protein [Holosporales bacterium]|jgi:competence protein ComEC|nr:ComEC/Rec2 family competence protein [Holosporales bacterium]
MRQIFEKLTLEKRTLPLFAPVVLGIGIIVGVFYPFLNFSLLLFFLVISLLTFLSLFKKFKISTCFMLIFSIGIYVAQTGGLLETSLLSHKQFVDEEYNSVKFLATVKFIDETHPTMRNMRRVTFKDMKFTENQELGFIKTAKMTCSSRMSDSIVPNDFVEVKGKISPYKPPAIPSSFDQKQYNAIIGLDTTGIVYIIKKLSSGKLKDVFSSARCHLTKRIVKKMGQIGGGIASSLLTGDKSSITPDIREKYINSGTAHILAISGLHMSIVSSLFFFLILKIMQYMSIFFASINPRRYAAITTIPITFLYLGLSGASPSAIRAFIMTTIALVSIIFDRKTISMRGVALAAFLILLFDSGSLFLVSFQLSFSAVVALISFYDNFRTQIGSLQTKFNKLSKKIYFYILSSGTTTFIASIATLPISVATFNRLSIAGIIGNLIAIPTITLIVMPLGILSLATCEFSDFFSIVLKHVLVVLTNLLGLVAEIPGSVVTVKSPSIPVLYTLTIGGIISTILATKLRNIGVALCFLGFILWIFETSPNIIVPPKSDVICFVENGKLYSTSLQKSRPQIMSIQRNLGFDGKLEKKKFNGYIPTCKHKTGIYIWTKLNIVKTLAERKHPYCPATFTILKNAH